MVVVGPPGPERHANAVFGEKGVVGGCSFVLFLFLIIISVKFIISFAVHNQSSAALSSTRILLKRELKGIIYGNIS